MMKTYTMYGYGFKCECEDKNIVEFIKAHKEAFCKTDNEKALYKRIENYSGEESLEDLFDDYGYNCEQSHNDGVYAVISNIMTREVNIRFLYQYECEECNTPATVMIEIDNLLDLNDKDKEEFKTTMYDICKRYMSELEIEGEPDYLMLEFFG